MKWLVLLFLGVFGIGFTFTAVSQDLQNEAPDPKVAFLKSLAVPGWGHYYVDRSDWNRGKYHLAAEVGLILSYVGFSVHSNNLEQNWYTYTRSEAGVDIEDRSRGFQLAVGNFNNLKAYNDYQERARNWDQLYEPIPENLWNWRTVQERNTYLNLRDRFERIDKQLPALIGLMVVNRVASALSAYNRARKRDESSIGTAASFNIEPYHGYGSSGMVARLWISF